jgi:hypothetical protein
MVLISTENRDQKLLENGIPKDFLENIGKVDELKYSVEIPEGAYFYLPTISKYQILKDSEVTPVYVCGETFFVLSIKNGKNRIIKFELENDEIYRDYGLNWDLLILEIMIDYFDFAIDDEISVDKFETVGQKIGFSQSKELFNLRNLEIEEYNSKFNDDKKWRMEIAEELKIL